MGTLTYIQKRGILTIKRITSILFFNRVTADADTRVTADGDTRISV